MCGVLVREGPYDSVASLRCVGSIMIVSPPPPPPPSPDSVAGVRYVGIIYVSVAGVGSILASPLVPLVLKLADPLPKFKFLSMLARGYVGVKTGSEKGMRHHQFSM